MDGKHKPWAKMEWERRGIQELSKEIIIVKSLIEFKSRSDSTKSKDNSKDGGEKEEKNSSDKWSKSKF